LAPASGSGDDRECRHQEERPRYQPDDDFTAHGEADLAQDRPDHEAHEQVDAGPQHTADDMDEIEEPMIVAHYRDRHHTERDHS